MGSISAQTPFADPNRPVLLLSDMCPYGESIPTHPVGKFVGMVCSGTGLLFLVAICLTAFIATTQRSGTAADVLRASVVKAMKQVRRRDTGILRTYRVAHTIVRYRRWGFG